jgi:hypothetical protein
VLKDKQSSAGDKTPNIEDDATPTEHQAPTEAKGTGIAATKPKD